VKIYLTNVIMIAHAIAFLWHLSLIAIWDRVLIQEPNPFILYSEMAGALTIIGFEVYNIVKLKGR